MSFWKSLKKPFFVLAPMANVTDAAFRKIIAQYGKPDVMWTEFVSADGLIKGNREILLKDLKYHSSERPIVAQFFSGDSHVIYEAGRLAVQLGFDGVDINMGCPDRAVMKQGGGGSLIKNPSLARELIQALQQGVEDECRKNQKKKIGISVKTRLGFNKIEIEKWISILLEENLDALTIHARTVKELSKVPAHWDKISEIMKLRDDIKSKTLIIGNGDVIDLRDADQKFQMTGVDGVMLGRAIFGTPWLFNKEMYLKMKGNNKKVVKMKLQIMLEHAELFEQELGGVKNFAIMKKHFKAYVNNFDGAKDIRSELMEAKKLGEVKEIVNKWMP